VRLEKKIMMIAKFQQGENSPRSHSLSFLIADRSSKVLIIGRIMKFWQRP
jgi:hypothetical protein